MDWVRDTSIGGAAGPFPSTLWSDILALGDPARAHENLDRLARAYWKPVYRYVRAAWGKSNEEAKDLTQEFFFRLIEGNRFAGLDPALGSFRAFLKTSLRNFLANEARDAAALKRGGQVKFVRPEEIADAAAAGKDPEAAFDREWAQDVLDASVAALRESLDREGKSAYSEAFRLFYRDGLTYRDVAARLSISEDDVRNHLTHARRVLRRILCERIREYLPSDAGIEDELNYLMTLWK